MTIIDALREVATSTELIAPKGSEIVGRTSEEKGALCYELRLKGIQIRAIAERYSVDKATIHRWINAYVAEYRESFEDSTKADILAEELLFLEHLQELGLHEMHMVSGSGEVIIDAETGKVKKPKKGKNGDGFLRQKLLKTVMDIRKQKQDLMLQTGILPKQPEHIYHKMSDERRDVDKEKTSTRTPKEIQDEIIRLIASMEGF